AARSSAERRGTPLPVRDRTAVRPEPLHEPLLQAGGARRGFPELTFHDLRHTGASLMIAAGCHVKAIAEQMGHADGGALVLKRSGHLYEGARRQAAIELESLVFTGRGDSAAGPVRDDAQLSWDFR